MLYSEITHCRICGNQSLHSILHLGQQALTGVFPRTPDEEVPSGPLELVKCDETNGGCGLVQLRHSYPPESMYGTNYGYRSGLNQSMVRHLHERVEQALTIARPVTGDLVLDIGSNDSTTLQAYPQTGLDLVGMDPTGVKFARYYPPRVRLIPDFFNADTFQTHFPARKAKIVTSFAMFYDLETPQDFMAQVERILADDGIWVFEQSYLPAMLQEMAYDSICHEHLSYYALRQIKWMADRVGLKIVAVERNDVNGGSFCVTVAKEIAPYPEAGAIVGQLLAAEEEMGLGRIDTYEAFRRRVFAHRDELGGTVRSLTKQGQRIYGYGASTKGNVLLQFCGLGPSDIPAIAEVNEDKFGACTPGTRIPIRSEAEVHACKPDYLLVLPWHFRKSIVSREQAYLDRGGKLLFPLPGIESVNGSNQTRAA